MRSAWRGEARSASAPKRARSLRGEPTTAIISIAQQASPKVSGNIEFEAAQSSSLLERGGEHRLLDVLLELGVVEVAAQQVAGAELADPQVLGRSRLGERGERPELLAPHLQSSAPLRQT